MKWLVSLILVSLLIGPTTVFAADSTPSADVQSKLKALQNEIASKAAKLKNEISKKLQNKAYIGVVKSKSSNTLTLATRSGTKVVNTNQDTIYEPVKKGGIKEEDNIAALGDIDETEVLTARKIVILPATTYPLHTKTILWGQILSISDELMTVQDKSGKNVAVSIAKVTNKVQQGQTIIVTGLPGKNEILNAQFIFIYPQTEKSKIATPSAEASKSASPSAKKKP